MRAASARLRESVFKMPPKPFENACAYFHSRHAADQSVSDLIQHGFSGGQIRLITASASAGGTTAEGARIVPASTAGLTELGISLTEAEILAGRLRTQGAIVAVRAGTRQEIACLALERNGGDVDVVNR